MLIQDNKKGYKNEFNRLSINDINALVIYISFLTIIILCFSKKKNRIQLQLSRQREQRLEQLMSALNDHVFVVEQSGKILTMNMILKADSIKMQDFEGSCFLDQVHSDDIQYINKCILEVFEKGNTVIFEFRILNERSEIRYTEAIGNPVYSEDMTINEVILACRDITIRKEYEEKMSKALKELQDIKFALDESTLLQIVDRQANILYANENFCKLSGYSFQELIGKNMRILNSRYHSKEYFKELWATLSKGMVWKGEMRNQSKDGGYFWVNTTIVPFLDEDKKPYQYIVIRNDITKMKENKDKLEYLSNVDGLTSLFNRRYFDKRFKEYWENCSVHLLSLSIIMFDVDYFKAYNDYYGHIMGDQCLILISNRVKTIINSFEAICARYGGEEFAVVLPGKNIDEAYEIAEEIRIGVLELNIPHEKSDVEKYVTISLGVASIVPNADLNRNELLKGADQALYFIKNNGRNSTHIKE
ncbi:GGDEF domain-containing protein [Paenibacillus sp. DMB5]|uniref:GGDEF domain-containing protein n=1 Tax=Paenibacillus sp. DMB5 TaxID=1780103 RepID=UPI00076C6246|nr:GGDEF domain-containing protein [Paenibacillus sp. DMB5]KUP20883.1 hypothetical protein AWJ19_06350 [Paenibacillus sp. DMB5]